MIEDINKALANSVCRKRGQTTPLRSLRILCVLCGKFNREERKVRAKDAKKKDNSMPFTV
jgi:hypothetical protein